LGQRQRPAIPPDGARRGHPAPGVALLKKHRTSARAKGGIAEHKGAHEFAQHLLTKVAERLRRGDQLSAWCRSDENVSFLDQKFELAIANVHDNMGRIPSPAVPRI
jgi:hypothetical protein